MGEHKKIVDGPHIHPALRSIRFRNLFKKQLIPAKRCPGFSSDCADVANHHHCHLGHLAATLENGITVDALIEADGYCPYLNGMLPR